MGQVYKLPYATDYPNNFSDVVIANLPTDKANAFNGVKNALFIMTLEADNSGYHYVTNTYGGTNSYNDGYIALYPGGLYKLGHVVTCGENVTGSSSSVIGKGWYQVEYFATPHTSSSSVNIVSTPLEMYNTQEEAYNAILGRYQITYRLVNCTAPSAPTEAVVGDTVYAPLSFTPGYGIVNPSDIYVTCNGVIVPSTYSNGVLTFTMPNPSE